MGFWWKIPTMNLVHLIFFFFGGASETENHSVGLDYSVRERLTWTAGGTPLHYAQRGRLHWEVDDNDDD